MQIYCILEHEFINNYHYFICQCYVILLSCIGLLYVPLRCVALEPRVKNTLCNRGQIISIIIL